MLNLYPDELQGTYHVLLHSILRDASCISSSYHLQILLHLKSCVEVVMDRLEEHDTGLKLKKVFL